MRTPDEEAEIARSIAAFTAGNDPNPGGRFPGGSYFTPDEARERGVAWTARPGEPQDLNDPYHFQTMDQWTGTGRPRAGWATQPAIRSGNARHAGFTPEMSTNAIWAQAMNTPDEQRQLADFLRASGQPVSTTMPVNRQLASLLTPFNFFSER